MMVERVAIILAAGISSRMKTKLPKVLHQVCGQPILDYMLDACRAAEVSKLYVVVGFGAEEIKKRYAGQKDIVWVTQAEQKGTGHAVLCCKEYLEDFEGETLIVCGDAPLVRGESLKALVHEHQNEKPALTLATTIWDEPFGYGRIHRDKQGDLLGIVEHNDCTEEQLGIKEINPSCYLYDNKALFDALAQIKADNVKNEYYITDTIKILLSSSAKVKAVTTMQPEEAIGVNSREQLAKVNKLMQQRIQMELMDNSVTIIDPDATWIQFGAQIGQDTVIEPFTYIGVNVTIGRNCRIGPHAFVGDGSIVEDGSQVGPRSAVGQ